MTFKRNERKTIRFFLPRVPEGAFCCGGFPVHNYGQEKTGLYLTLSSLHQLIRLDAAQPDKAFSCFTLFSYTATAGARVNGRISG
jgi:hypothetical protein